MATTSFAPKPEKRMPSVSTCRTLWKFTEQLIDGVANDPKSLTSFSSLRDIMILIRTKTQCNTNLLYGVCVARSSFKIITFVLLDWFDFDHTRTQMAKTIDSKTLPNRLASAKATQIFPHEQTTITRNDCFVSDENVCASCVCQRRTIK